MIIAASAPLRCSFSSCKKWLGLGWAEARALRSIQFFETRRSLLPIWSVTWGLDWLTLVPNIEWPGMVAAAATWWLRLYTVLAARLLLNWWTALVYSGGYETWQLGGSAFFLRIKGLATLGGPKKQQEWLSLRSFLCNENVYSVYSALRHAKQRFYETEKLRDLLLQPYGWIASTEKSMASAAFNQAH